MKYLKYFESVVLQQPFYLSNDHLYLSEDLSKLVTPTLAQLKKIYKHNKFYWANRTAQDQVDFYNDVRKDTGHLKIRTINIQQSVSFGGNSFYCMNLSLNRRESIFNTKFGTFRNYLGGNSGDHNMHDEKNMKRATRECNLNFVIKLYPIVEHIKNFEKIFKSKDKGFLDIIKNAIDKDITLAQYGIPNEIKHLFDERIENAVKTMIKYNI